MTENLTTALAALVLLVSFAALVHYARRDTFTVRSVVPGNLDGFARDNDVVVPQRAFTRAAADVRPATYESHATTATA